MRDFFELHGVFEDFEFLLFVDLTVMSVQDPFLTTELIVIVIDLNEFILRVGHDEFSLVLQFSNLIEELLVEAIHLLEFFFGGDDFSSLFHHC